MSRTRAALVLAMLLLVSATAPAATAATTAPGGMVNVASENIKNDLPNGYQGGLSAGQLRGGVMSSAHADTLEVTVTTPDRAGKYVNGKKVGKPSDDVALVLSDDVNHPGRKVGLPVAALRSSFGHIPEQVHGVHENGTKWTRATTVDGGTVVFEVPGFSSNVVTFESTTRLEGSPATNGTTWRYNLSSLDGASDPVVNLTGVTNTETDTVTGTNSAGESASVSVGGNSEPVNSSIQITQLNGESISGYSDSTVRTAGSSAGDTLTFTVPVSTAENRVSSINIDWGAYGSSTFSWDVSFYAAGGNVGSAVFNTTEIGREQGDWSNDGDYVGTENTAPDLSTGYDTVTIGVKINDASNLDRFDVEGVSVGETKPANITISSDEGSVSPSSTGTYDMPLALSTETLSFNGTGSVDWTLNYTERTQTQDPGVELNGETVSHTGTLADGETVSLTGQSSWLVEGENVVSVVVDDPSADAPPGQVNVTVEHDSQDTQTFSSESGKWVQEATVAKTFPSDRADASVQVALDGGVVNIKSLQECRNGTCSTVSSENYALNTTSDTLTVELGAVDAGANVSVQFEARKVSVVNGTIDVLTLTPPGSDLATEFEITSHSAGFAVDVGGTSEGDRLHYVDAASWTASPFARVDATGGQEVRLPDAGVGSTATMRTIPVSVVTNTGTADVRVLDGPALEIRVLDSTADALTYTYLAAEGGQAYRLWSLSDSEEASAADGPDAEFVSGGQAESYRIEEKPSSGSTTEPTISAVSASDGPPIFQLLALFAGITGALLGTVFVGRRFGFSTGRSNALLAVVGTTVGVVGVELATAESVIGLVVQAVLAGAFGGGAGSVVVGTLLLTTLFVVDARFLELPTTVLLLAGGLVVLYVVNGVTGGALSDGLRDTGALIWLLVVGGGLLVLWRAVKGPTIKIGGGNQ